MRRRTVIQAATANRDIIEIYFQIADHAGHAIAENYIARIENYITHFDLASERGTKRDDLMQGLRIIGFERRVTIAFTVDPDQVTILRIFYGGQDWEEEWDDSD